MTIIAVLIVFAVFAVFMGLYISRETGVGEERPGEVSEFSISHDTKLITLRAGSTDRIVNLSPLVDGLHSVSSGVTGLATRVDVLETGINDHEGRIGANTSSIDNHEGRIATNTSSITGLATRVDALETEINDHEGRIVANTSAIIDLQSVVTAQISSITDDVLTLTARIAVEEEAAFIRDGTLFSRIINGLEPDVSLTSRNIFPTDFMNMFNENAVNNGSVFTSASINTSKGKRSLKLPNDSTLRWHTPNHTFKYSLGCTFALLLGDLRFDSLLSGGFVEYWMASNVALPMLVETDSIIYSSTYQTNILVNGNTGPSVQCDEFEDYGPGDHHMVIIRALGNRFELFSSRGGTASTPDMVKQDSSVSDRGPLSYFGVNGASLASRTGVTEVLGIYQWTRALSDQEIDILRTVSNRYVATFSRMPSATYPSVSVVAQYAAGTNAVSPIPPMTPADSALTNRLWTVTGGATVSNSGVVTLTKVGKDSTVAVRCRITASSSKTQSSTAAVLEQRLYINGIQHAPGVPDVSSFTNSCSTTSIVSLRKNDTIQLKYSRFSGNGNFIIFNRSMLVIEQL